MVLELIPIGTLLAVITTQLIETAVAAQDVLVEKESFRVLGKYILDIEPVLVELKNRELRDSPTVRTALNSLQDDVRKARTLIDNCISKPKMYLLVHCRSIVRDAQQITRDLAKSLQLMALASAEVAVDIGINVDRLKHQMMRAQFQASESKLVVINKLEQGLREHRTDQGFANDLLRDIAIAVGIPVNATEISKELASFKKEKEEASLRKEREEEAFMEQVIILLSRADAAYLPESSSSNFFYGRVPREDINSTELIQPLKSFICPLKQDVMVDPVSLVTGSCFERSCIATWFAEGNTSDPVTHEELVDMTLRPNIPVRQSIEEWQERNYVIGILKAKSMLQSGDERQQRNALEDIVELCKKSKQNKDWIATEGLVVDIVNTLRSPSRDVKIGSLSALHSLVKNSATNKELLADAGGVELAVRCLSRETTVAKSAAALLLESMDGNDTFSLKIGKQRSAILLLVTLLNSKDEEAAQLARLTLHKLSRDTENVVEMAKANWCIPLISSLCAGTDDSSKLFLVKALGTLKLTDESRTSLAEQGAIAPLVRMMDSGKLEVKLAALEALQNLSSHRPIKIYISEAGAIPSVLNHLFSGMSPVNIREAAAAILDHVAASDGLSFFVDASGVSIDVEQMVENLLAVQENSFAYPVIQGHVLRTLLGIVSSTDAKRIRETTRSMHGISMLLPLIGRADRDIRDAVIQILQHLSDEGGAEEIAAFLQKHQKFRAVLNLLDNSMHENAQAAAAGLLASLPENAAITLALIEAEAIPTLVSALQAGTPKVKETALGALIRFTESSNIEMQRSVANLNVHPLLVRLIHSGTSTCKERAATALSNFSKNTSSLSVQPDMLCNCWRSSRYPKCKVHSGRCSVKTTFCIVEADAVPGLVGLINEGGTAAVAALEALESLIIDDDILQAGAQVIHNSNGITPVLHTLNSGGPELKEKALNFLERIFMAKGMKETYGNKSRIPLVELASSSSSILIRKRAAKVMAQLQFINELSTYY